MFTLTRVLVPSDFSPLAELALACARSLCETYGAELHVLHVHSPAADAPVFAGGAAGDSIAGTIAVEPPLADMEERGRQLQSYVKERIGDSAAVTSVAVGSPWQEITRYAEREGIDLIVMGTHARGIVQRIFIGSTSKAVLEHASCPVLMVPQAVRDRTHARRPSTDRAVSAGGRS